MEKPSQSFDVCIVCALPEEARAFLEILQERCEGVLEERMSPRYQYSYRFATLKNQKDEPLNLHISWLPRYGPQEMTLHLSRVMEECQPRIAIMTGICAGDAQQVQLGDLVVAERTFTYDNGKFTHDEQGRTVHLHDTMTYQLDANILQFLGLFDDWKPLIATLESPPSSLEPHNITCHIKAMASGSTVRANHPFEDIQAPVRGTVAIDMEGAAFGLVMSRHPLIRWMAVKGVCDYADQHKNDAYHDYAARASAIYALSFIRAYVTNERLPRSDRPLSPGRNDGLPFDAGVTQTKYLQRMHEQYSIVKLPVGAVGKPGLVKKLSLQAIFQPLKLRRDPLSAEELAREERRSLMDELIGDSEEDSLTESIVIAKNGEDALNKSPRRRMIVLGGPGTGKTTLLKYLVGEHSQRAMTDPSAPIPIFISLPELIRSKSLKEYLLSTLQDMIIDDHYADVLWAAIENGRAFICLDSLDEVLSQRLEVIQKINTWVSSSSMETSWIVASRFTDYKGWQLDYEQFTEWELQPLNHILRQELAGRLLPQLQQVLHSHAQTRLYEPSVFVDTMEMHSRVAAWSKSPMLFSLAAVIFVRTGKLPNSQAELYQQALDAILETREPLLEKREMLYSVLMALSLKLYLDRKGRSFTLRDLMALLRKVRKEQDESWDVETMTRRIVNSGVLEVVAKATYGFLHQTFQEYLAAKYILSLTQEEAEQEISQLLESIDEPFCRQVIIELVYLANYQAPHLEDDIYHRIIARLEAAKMGLLADQLSGRLTSSAAITGGIDYLIQELIDHWSTRLCATLEAGSADRVEDAEVASLIASVLERNPRAFATTALIGCLYKYSKYKKIARCIGALGNIATNQAKEALFSFTQQQMTNSTDRHIFRYLAAALGKARVEQAIPLLQAMRDESRYDSETKFEARRALWLLGAEKDFEEKIHYTLEDVLTALSVEDEDGRQSDWKRVVTMATWLQQNGPQDQFIQNHFTQIIPTLEKASNHQIDNARKAVVNALGELGNAQTFEVLFKRLIERTEPSRDVAKMIVSSLVRLREREQISSTGYENLKGGLPGIQKAYPWLEEELKRLN